MFDERCIQTVSTPFDIFKNKGNVKAMLKASLNQFKFHSTHFQQAFNIVLRFRQCSNASTFGSTTVLNACTC